MTRDRSRIAVKRLAVVEVDPERSHQHELNAGRLRQELGFPLGRTEGDLTVLLFRGGEAAPEVSEGGFTLYDARERIPGRSEYRLYYETVLMRGARAEDLLVLYREPGTTNLHAIVAPPGSSVESELLRLLQIGADADLASFQFLQPAEADESEAAEAAEELVTVAGIAAAPYSARDHPVYAQAVAEGHLPDTATMARAGYELALEHVDQTDPDGLLSRGLEAETELFYEIRDQLLQPQHDALVAGGAPVREILDWAQKQHQSARSRRGDSLQHHFEKILGLREIPYTPQCPTEGDQTPDFVIPGREAYHDPAFPGDRLRMVACKSTVRERWAQILVEAERIPDKYLLTLDRRLTSRTIREMADRRLSAFLPASVIADYWANPEVGRLRSVSALIGELEAVL